MAKKKLQSKKAKAGSVVAAVTAENPSLLVSKKASSGKYNSLVFRLQNLFSE